MQVTWIVEKLDAETYLKILSLYYPAALRGREIWIFLISFRLKGGSKACMGVCMESGSKICYLLDVQLLSLI